MYTYMYTSYIRNAAACSCQVLALSNKRLGQEAMTHLTRNCIGQSGCQPEPPPKQAGDALEAGTLAFQVPKHGARKGSSILTSRSLDGLG